MKSLKDFIIDDLNQISIFSKYFDITESDIQHSISFKIKLSNPLRNDPNPSLIFKSYSDKIIARDYGDPNYCGDIFEVIGYIINKDCRDSKDFIDICKHIINNGVITKKQIDKTDKITNPTIITHIPRDMNNNDFRYFSQYCLPKEVILNSYIAVKSYHINGIPSNYLYKPADPCYLYKNNPNSVKLYFPLRPKTKKRFITNNKIPIELINTLTKKDFTVLIKGYKDKIMMDYVCMLLNIHNINFIPVASESARLDDSIIALLRNYTIKDIFTMFDTDRCGLESSIYYKENYGFKNIFINDGQVDKDPSDFMRTIKIIKFTKLFKIIYTNVFK